MEEKMKFFDNYDYLLIHEKELFHAIIGLDVNTRLTADTREAVIDKAIEHIKAKEE